MGIIWILACTAPTPAPTPEAALPTPMALDALASRIALDLVGRRPTEAELDALDADPDSLSTQIDLWLNDPAFEERVVSLYADVYRSRADQFVVGADGDVAFLDLTYRAQFQRSVGEEPLRLLARIAATDQAWTEVVTADWSMGNDYLLEHFPMEEVTPGEDGWRPVHYLDGRPAVGVLATNGLWWRYVSNAENVNRGRAAAMSRILLCDTRYEMPVNFEKSNAAVDVKERVASDPACVGCHVSLDPLASSLFGFWRHHPESYSEALRYYPSREQDWVTLTGIAPSYYGQDTPSLYYVGRAIARDPRFVNCALEQVWTFLLGRGPQTQELDRFTEDRAAFLEGGLHLKDAFRAVVTDPAYQSNAENGTPPRRLTPDQLASSVEALTGYRWRVQGGLDAMVNDDHGYRILDGGLDGILVTEASSTETATVALVEERLAEAGAFTALQREMNLPPEERMLFGDVPDLNAEPSDDEKREQIRHLLRQVFGRRAEESEIDPLVELWDTIHQSAGPADSWAFFLSALLRHPDFVHY